MSQPQGTPNPNAKVEAAARELGEEQAKEYSEFVAVDRIYAGSALAYAPGHPVPASNVQAHGYLEQGLVARRYTKAAKEITGEPAGISSAGK